MGQQQSCTIKSNRPIKIKRKLTLKSHLHAPVICPFCNQEFSHKATYSSLNEHLYKCGNSSKGESTKQDSADISDNDFQLVIDYTADHFNSPINNALKQESQMKETSALTEKQKSRYASNDRKGSRILSTLTCSNAYVTVSIPHQIEHRDR